MSAIQKRSQILEIGGKANTIIFSLVDGVLLRPLSYREPGQLVVVNEVITEMAGAYPRLPVSARHYLDWRATARSFQELGIADGSRRVLTGMGEPEQLDVARVSASFLPMLGAQPRLGRLFLVDEDQPGRDNVSCTRRPAKSSRPHRACRGSSSSRRGS